MAGQEKLKQKKAQEKAQGIISPDRISHAEKGKQYLKEKGELLKSDVYFQYNEGFSNAVRRTILVKDILK